MNVRTAEQLCIAMLRCAVNATTGSPTSYQTDAACCRPNTEPYATGKKRRFLYQTSYNKISYVLSNSFAVESTIISLFDVESQIFITMATRTSLWQISVTLLY